MSLYPYCELQNLPILRSDHGLILLTCNHIPRRIPKAFRFEAMWLAHKDFDKVVTQTWNSAYSGNAAQKLQTCYNTFKHQLKSWNRNVFGDLFLKLKTAQENLHLTQEQLAQNPYSPYLLDKDSKLHTELKILLEQEEVFYAQKARAIGFSWETKIPNTFTLKLSLDRNVIKFLELRILVGFGWMRIISRSVLLRRLNLGSRLIKPQTSI